MKKILYFTILLLFPFFAVYGQISTYEEPESFRTNLPALRVSEKTQIILPEIDMEKIRQEDKEDEENGFPPRFGYRHEVNYNMENSGEWTDLPNGDKILKCLLGQRNYHIFANK